MSQVKLNWTNILSGSFSQIVEKKINDAEWTGVNFSIEPVPEMPNDFFAYDTDITFAEDTLVTYRITTINGSLHVFGNEVMINIPAMPSAVANLAADLVNE